MKKLILLISLSILTFASTLVNEKEYYLYKLYNNKFQAVFPGNPTIQEIPQELLDSKMIVNSLPYEYRKQLTQSQIDKIVSNTIQQFRNNQPYIYADQNSKVWFKVQSMPSNLEHKNYIWSGIKNTIDNLLKNTLKADNRTIIDFSSNIYKYEDKYIAKYTSFYFLDGQKVYSSTKNIYYKDKTYQWTVSYINKTNKQIFDDYENNIKILK
jgi:hypothetical protein